MILAFDLDDCLCKRPHNIEHLGGEKYKYCSPIESMVGIVNDCYGEGHHIKIYTARGMSTYNGTNDLKQWGVKYHELIMGKEHYDLLIDDKVINSLRVKSISDIKDFNK